MQPIVPIAPSPVPSPAVPPLPAMPAPEGAQLAPPPPEQAGSGGMPNLAQLERAGVPLVLAAEASGRLRAQHRFLYAAAGDLRVADVSALLVEYKASPMLRRSHAPMPESLHA